MRLEVSFLEKKFKQTATRKDGTQQNKIWDGDHDDFIIPYLAELASQRYKGFFFFG